MHDWFCWFDAVRAEFPSLVVFFSLAPCVWQPLVRCLAGVQVCGFFWEITSRNVSVFCVIWFDSGYRFMLVYGGVAGLRSLLRNSDRYAQGNSATSCVDKDVDMPVVRRAENCGALQLQFVDQVGSSLFGNRDTCAQCNCAVLSC